MFTYTLPAKLELKHRVITPNIRKVMLDAWDNRCHLCESSDHLEVDHIISVQDGGLNDPSNLMVLCKSCNMQKIHNPPDVPTLTTRRRTAINRNVGITVSSTGRIVLKLKDRLNRKPTAVRRIAYLLMNSACDRLDHLTILAMTGVDTVHHRSRFFHTPEIVQAMATGRWQWVSGTSGKRGSLSYFARLSSNPVSIAA